MVDLSVVGHRRVGGVARQHAVARRRGARVRDRRVRAGCGRRWRGGSASTWSVVPGDWTPRRRSRRRRGRRCAADREHAIRAVLVVHNETSTGVTSRLPAIRQAIDRAGHPALLLVDAVSSLGVDRAAARRVGHRRHARGLAERADAAARPRLQRDQREGAGGVAVRAAAAVVLGVGADARRQRRGVLPLHAGDQPAVRPARGAARC